MPTGILYDIDGVGDVSHRLLGMGARAMETRPLLTLFADQLEQEMVERFATEGGGEWDPLAESTVRRKGSSVIGRETDAMMKSLTEESAPGALREYFGDELIFGTNLTSDDGVPYPAIFDAGQDGQPARPLFDLATLDLRKFTKAVQAYLIGLDRSEFGANMGGDRIAGSDRMPSF